MSNNNRKEISPMDNSARQFPTDESLGVLEAVAYFNGPMPTGVTVSHRGRIFVNFPKWGDDVQYFGCRNSRW